MTTSVSIDAATLECTSVMILGRWRHAQGCIVSTLRRRGGDVGCLKYSVINAERMPAETKLIQNRSGSQMNARNVRKSSVLQACRRDQALPEPATGARIVSVLTQIHNMRGSYDYLSKPGTPKPGP